MDKIQMVDLHGQYLDIKDKIDTAIQAVLDDTSFINGPVVTEFCNNLAKWNQTDYVIPCANGTDGLQLALMSLSLKPGDEVIVPAFTYIATVEVIALLKLKPVFVDVNYDNFNLDVNQIESVITSKTKAIVPVHLFGQCADMDEIKGLADRHGLLVIEDLAQAIGSEYKGVKAGNLGHIGVTSFFPSKNLGCYGDGGALLTNDKIIADKIRMIANHGQSKKYYHDCVGINSRLDTLQAAILNEKLARLDNYIDQRQKAAKYYDTVLAENQKDLELPEKESYSTHVYHQYTLKVESRRDGLKQYLMNKGIPTMIYYPLPITDQKAYKLYKTKDFPIAEQLSKKVLSLPMHTHLSEASLDYICETIKSYFK